ncbi:hypothetical protein OIU76_026018 [Salix suchowensis]|nr:hypothetical protein OIU76_026018 [Salix suchowensis]
MKMFQASDVQKPKMRFYCSINKTKLLG